MSEVKKLRIPTAKNETIWLCTLQHINRITHAAGNQSLKSGSSDFNSGTQTTRSRWLRFLINTNMNSLIFYLRSESFILNRRRLPTSSETKKSILILFPKTTWFMQGLWYLYGRKTLSAKTPFNVFFLNSRLKSNTLEIWPGCSCRKINFKS